MHYYDKGKKSKLTVVSVYNSVHVIFSDIICFVLSMQGCKRLRGELVHVQIFMSRLRTASITFMQS